MARIFVSYARDDASLIARNLVNKLRVNHTVFFDIDSIIGTIDWEEEIKLKIKNIDLLIFLCTDATTDSEGMFFEFDQAIRNNVPILPLWVNKAKLPTFISSKKINAISVEAQDISAMVLEVERSLGHSRKNLWRHRLTGIAAIILISLLGVGSFGIFSCWVASNCVSSPRQILFSSNRDGDSDLYLMDSNGNNIINITNNTANDYQGRWSSDGNKIVFVSDRDGNAEIYTMASNGTDVRRITNNLSNDESPMWSPNDQQLVFVSNLGSHGGMEIFLVNIDNSGNTLNISNNPANDEAPSWSPDGHQIIFVSSRDGNPNLYRMDINGYEVSRFVSSELIGAVADNGLPNIAHTPMFSPDGGEIVFSLDIDGNFWIQEIYSVSIGDPSIIRRWTNDQDMDGYPSWSPDGNNIIYVSGYMESSEICITTVSSGENRCITNNTFSDNYPSWKSE
jgi:TolB protein